MIIKKIIEEAKKFSNYIPRDELNFPKFDSSSFVVSVYKRAVGINLPHYIGDLVNKGVKVSKKDLKPGDLVFPTQNHVGIYIGNNKFIHVPKSESRVKISNLYNFYTARRILNK